MQEDVFCNGNSLRNEVCKKRVSILLMEEIRLTTWDVSNPENNGIFNISIGAGFL